MQYEGRGKAAKVDENVAKWTKICRSTVLFRTLLLFSTEEYMCYIGSYGDFMNILRIGIPLKFIKIFNNFVEYNFDNFEKRS